MNVKHKKGIIAECYAKAWLLENFNCMVYTPENGLGPIDIIARYEDYSIVTNLSCPKCYSHVDVYYPSEKLIKEYEDYDKKSKRKKRKK